jgi:hypothetical protein
LNREKSRNVDLQNSVATARGSENSAVKRRGESLATLSEARLAVKAKDEEHEALTVAWRFQRKTLMDKFIELTRNGGRETDQVNQGFGKFSPYGGWLFLVSPSVVSVFRVIIVPENSLN